MDIPIPVKPPKVLIVDDVRANRVLLKAVVKMEGVQVVEVDSGKQAILETEKHEFALILMDVQMPGMSGFEVASHLQESELTRYIPIIFLTANARDEKFIKEGYESGAVDYLFKPFNGDILKHKIRVFIELYREKKRVLSMMGKLANEMAERERAEKEQQRLSKQLGKRQDMEMTGKIASGVAHGINAIMGSLEQDIEVIIDNTHEDDENYERLQNVQKSTKRALNYVRGMLVVGREGDKARAREEAQMTS